MRARRGCAWLLIWLWAAASSSFGQTSGQANGAQPVLIGRFAAPPSIDGKLDEPVWRQAAALSGFHQTQPGDNTAPSYATTVHLGYDTKRLYLGIRAIDDPKKIRATVAKRDQITNDDYVAIYLDTFNDRRRAYLLMFNPLGAQQDGLFIEGGDPDFSVDIVMESKGVLTEDGYTIEAAIPFSSLRYEAGKNRLWGLHALRYIKHLDEEDSWAPLRREVNEAQAQFAAQNRARQRINFLAQAGHVAGLDGIAGERTLEIIPTLTLSETGRRTRTASPLGDSSRFVNQPVGFDPGLTVKLTLTSGLTLDAAFNPDFGEVEADQPQITANQRFPLFFEERRPFFLEGIDIFRTPIQAVHTRAIIDPDVAMKLSGKRGRNTFGLLAASDNAPGNYSQDERNDPALRPNIARFLDKNSSIGALRWKRDIGRQSSIGLLATSYNFIERRNQLAGVDGRLSLGPQTFFTFQLLGAVSRRYFYSPDEDRNIYRTGRGLAYFAQLQRSARHLNLSLTGRGYTADYRADVGFTSRTDTNAWDALARYNSEPRSSGRLISWSVASSTRAQFDWKGRMQYSFEAIRTQANFRRQSYIKADVYRDYARIFETEFGPRRTATRPGAFFGPPERSTFWNGFTVEAGTAPSKRISATLIFDRSWHAFDYDLGAGPRFPRVSRAALALGQNAPLDPGPGATLDLIASLNVQPTDSLRLSFDYTRSRLTRDDTRLTAFDQRLYSLRAAHQFTRFTFARARIDYDTARASVRAQFLLGWTPHPGTSFYAGYNDDVNYNGYDPFTNRFERGWRRNNRTFFIKLSYLFRRGI